MAEGDRRTRRTFLSVTGAAFTVIAGCSGGNESNTTATTLTTTTTTTSSNTTTTEETTAEETTTQEKWSVDPLNQDKLVGAFYYAWYWGENGYAIFPDRPWLEHSPYTPELGEYDSRNRDVVNQHIKWALENGINWFVINTGHPGGKIMRSIRESFREAELANRIHYSFDIGFDHAPVTDEHGRYVLDAPENLEDYRRNFRAYADFFEDSNYARIEGRPVLFDFSTPNLTGDLTTGLDEIKKSIDEDPYIIANPTWFWTPSARQPETRPTSKEIFEAYDAVRKYAPIPPSGSDEIEENYISHWADKTEYWRFLSEHHDTDYIPSVIPGLNDQEIKWDRVHHDILNLSPDEFREMCSRSLDYVDPDLDAVVITSWNEFPEGTTIEPTEEYGHQRLEIVREELGKGQPDPIRVDEYVLLELDFNRTVYPDKETDTRQLSFFLQTVVLNGENGTVKSYDIGTLSKEPTFVEGAYYREDYGDATGRWLGGPTQKAVFYVLPEAADALEAVLRGRPISPGDIEADVYWDGTQTDRVAFNESEGAEYRFSLS